MNARSQLPLASKVIGDDPDLSPASRAQKLKALLAMNWAYDEHDALSSLIDLLADARHFADANGIEYAKADRTAHLHYSTERTEGAAS